MVTRKDITTKAPVYEATRTKTSRQVLILPIAYGVNDATVNVKLENHQPIQNQNNDCTSYGGNERKLFSCTRSK